MVNWFLLLPTVSWKKDGSVLRSEGRLLIRDEGDRHTLLLREVRATDAGSYTATATNELGQASCAGSLAVRPGRDPASLGLGKG
jgi:serine/threonine protein kinase